MECACPELFEMVLGFCGDSFFVFENIAYMLTWTAQFSPLTRVSRTICDLGHFEWKRLLNHPEFVHKSCGMLRNDIWTLFEPQINSSSLKLIIQDFIYFWIKLASELSLFPTVFGWYLVGHSNLNHEFCYILVKMCEVCKQLFTELFGYFFLIPFLNSQS